MSQLEHTIIFDSEITKKTVQNLINDINQYAFVNLYFSTVGGCLVSMDILIDFLNHRYNSDSIKVTLFNEVNSAGTWLLTDYQGPLFQKRLKIMVFHAPDFKMQTIRKTDMDEKLVARLEQDNEEYYESLVNLGFKKAQIDKIRSGGDIILYQEDFNKLKRPLFIGEEVVTNYTIKK